MGGSGGQRVGGGGARQAHFRHGLCALRTMTPVLSHAVQADQGEIRERKTARRRQGEKISVPPQSPHAASAAFFLRAQVGANPGSIPRDWEHANTRYVPVEGYGKVLAPALPLLENRNFSHPSDPVLWIDLRSHFDLLLRFSIIPNRYSDGMVASSDRPT